MSRITPNKSRKISYRAGLIKAIKDSGSVTCYLCFKSITRASEVTVDHIIPVSRGGQNISANWQPAHKRCNTQKGNRILPELVAWIPAAPVLEDKEAI